VVPAEVDRVMVRDREEDQVAVDQVAREVPGVVDQAGADRDPVDRDKDHLASNL
jgi:hypothetical protein